MQSKEILTKSVVRLIMGKPFFGHLIQQLEKTVTNSKSGPTACVAKRPDSPVVHFIANDDYVKHLFNKDGMDGVVKLVYHETLHVSLGHLFLTKPDHIRWNVALDLCVNSFIGSVPTGWQTPEMYKLPSGKSGTWYYDQLQDNDIFQKLLKEGAFAGMGDHGYVGDDIVSRESLKKSIEQAKEAAGKEYGSLPSDMREMIEAAIARTVPPISWTKLLRLYTATMVESSIRFTLKRESDRFGTRPGPMQEEELNVLVCLDTSGSMSSKQLSVFLAEIHWMWRSGYHVDVCEADCAVVKDPVRYNGELSFEMNGRGGTDLNPALVIADKGRYDVCVYFTDFCAPKVERCKTPVLWVLTHKFRDDEGPADFGRRIFLEDAE
jgi:predicted metal-dependent peptidase